MAKIPVPLYKGMIKVKVLKMPSFIEGGRNKVRKELPKMSKSDYVQVYRNQLCAKVQHANIKGAHEVSKSFGGDLFENISSLTGGIFGGTSQQNQKPQQTTQQQPPSQNRAPQPTPPSQNNDPVQKMAKEGMQKLNSAAEKLTGVFGNITSNILGGSSGYKEQREADAGLKAGPDIKLNFSDDENIEEYGDDWLKMAKSESKKLTKQQEQFQYGQTNGQGG